jgi:alginate O-acetyltransferase complex protein AlgI
MLFNSAEFLFLFLPVVLLVFVFLARVGNTQGQIIWLVLASIIFYGSWNPYFVTLIIFSVVANFFVGRRLTASRGNARAWLISGVIFNLGLLGYFKYVGFFAENLSAVGLWLIPLPKIVLPLAISFFTFQQIAYLVDVARGECKEYLFLQYALFVMFFPQLIAGPIVHHKEMMPQFEKLRPRGELWADIAVGLTIIAIGLFKKVVLADSLAQYADPLFSAAEQGVSINVIDSWIATFSFSFQIYFDFSGYSDMAIGCARLFGIRLPENFRSPYKSDSIIEFWRRWHMTLSRFLRDYLYFSLGGNRHGNVKRYRNLLLTMLLGGLWHGAAWTFVIWGGLQGAYLCINHGWRALCRKLGLETLRNSPLMKPMYIFITSLCWSLAFVVFRATDVESALAIITPGFTQFSELSAPLLQQAAVGSVLGKIYAVVGLVDVGYWPVYSLLAICGFICWFMPNTQQYLSRFDPVIGGDSPQAILLNGFQWQPSWLAAGFVALMLSLSLLSLSAVTEFIYFQF